VSSRALTPFSYLVLALVGRNGATAHELVRMQRHGEAYFAHAESQWYAEPKRLAALGLLSAEVEPGVTRERTRYRLTEAGVAALRSWLPEPPRPPHVSSEGIVKVLAADLGRDEDVAASIASLRPELERMLAQLAEGEANVGALPHRARYLRLNHRLAHAVLEAHLAWVDEVERELGGEAPGEPS
jgi:DNA-binding PadR family transcriptional regulator